MEQRRTEQVERERKGRAEVQKTGTEKIVYLNRTRQSQLQLQRLQIEAHRLQAEAAEQTRRAELKAAEKARRFELKTQRLQIEIQKRQSKKT